MTYTLLQASANALPLSDESVQCVVTSPPYWGLRTYAGEQCQAWGGDRLHSHEWGPEQTKIVAIADKREQEHSSDRDRMMDGVRVSQGAFCPCGAWYGALGLEPTPELYVEHMVEVFREVRRVLRSDGVLWLNLGSSYAGGGNGGGGSFTTERPGWSVFGGIDPSPSRQPSRAPAYGSGDTERSGSTVPDSVCPDLCDECRAALSPRIVHSDRQTPGSPSPLVPKDRGSGHLGSEPASPGASPPASQASTTDESAPPHPAECSHCDNCGACLSVLRSTSRDARLCARRTVGTAGTSPLGDSSVDHIRDTEPSRMAWGHYTSTLGAKQLVPIPWMVAMALQEDGWILRCDIIWSKPNPMPESVTDRPTKSHEYLFLLSKLPTYYYDADAIREPFAPSSIARIEQDTFDQQAGGEKDYANGTNPNRSMRRTLENFRDSEQTGRNKRDVWTIATVPYPGAHFATFPEALVEPCILAGSSPQACGECGAPWERLTEHTPGDSEAHQRPKRTAGMDSGTSTLSLSGNGSKEWASRGGKRTTAGWQPTCEHDDGSGQSVVLDVFNGSGTTGRVALRHGRRYVGVDIAREYLEELSVARIDPLTAQKRAVEKAGSGQAVMW